jgi:hypothetical protein
MGVKSRCGALRRERELGVRDAISLCLRCKYGHWCLADLGETGCYKQDAPDSIFGVTIAIYFIDNFDKNTKSGIDTASMPLLQNKNKNFYSSLKRTGSV